ncbi:MarR family winged helix-turn-helix transcriptional regulator [Actinoplanes sp. Pm04-4]|uniref:MarR family winged helix-turn-helix transcriptional regulator n=1 Tax=Paractinoplanes pyxinae TaxID=2997416 RepID=A0ABT4B5R0_9ACTN|nr:MarR family winged helix-turn-helix transcriptional regulator [Actinoplanes pyxinae]MCY1140970.1 MarR family winged helix-turn-helix transcriptional regulator [Actinoplanes pyxinae]
MTRTDEMEDVLASQLLELSQLIRKARQQWLRERPDVPIGTVSILKLIDEIGTAADGCCHAKDLAERSGLDPSTVSRAVAAAVGQGLVERGVDSTDRRASTLSLTPAGHELLVAANAWFGALIGHALADWPEDEVERVSGALGRFSVALSAVLEKSHNLEAAR